MEPIDTQHTSVAASLPRSVGGYVPEDVEALVWTLQRRLRETEVEIAALRAHLESGAEPLGRRAGGRNRPSGDELHRGAR